MASSYLYLNGLRIHYLVWNREEAGTPVVLLHDLGANARCWEPVASLLARETASPLYALDLRGHGQTDQPEGEYALEACRRDLSACLEAWDLPHPVFAGHGWGSVLALDTCAHFSIGPRAPAGLVLVDGGLLVDDPETAGGLCGLSPHPSRGATYSELVQRFQQAYPRWRLEELSIPLVLASYEVVEELEEGRAPNGKAGTGLEERLAPRLSSEHHTQLARAAQAFPAVDSLARLRCPVLAAPARPPLPHAEGDRRRMAAWETALERAVQRSPALQIQWMQNTYHEAPLHRPEAVSALILDFLRTL